jgi:hypothetical protein
MQTPWQHRCNQTAQKGDVAVKRQENARGETNEHSNRERQEIMKKTCKCSLPLCACTALQMQGASTSHAFRDMPLDGRATIEASIVAFRVPIQLAMVTLGITDAGAVVSRGAAMVAASVEAIEKVATELALSREELQTALAGIVDLAEKRFGDFVKGLALESVLPLIGSRAYGHFRHQRRESRDDAEDLSHNVVANALGALRRSAPRGNAGAWLAAIREHVYADHVRKREQKKRAEKRIENAWQSKRRWNSTSY